MHFSFRVLGILTLYLFFCSQVNSQALLKTLRATKVSQPPKLDGSLADEVWHNVTPATDFIENFPNYGQPAMVKTEVKLIYTDAAIFIGAYLYDTPSLVRKQLTQRDREAFQDVDNFGVAFDTYKDKQNAFQFIVTSVNVQSDVRIAATSGSDFDYNWDAVWDSRIGMTDSGWIVEMMIPFSAIRFSKEDIQDWGINFSRFIRRTNQNLFWNPINPKENGFVNQFGTLEGLQNLQPPLRLSFLPYISLGYQNIPTNTGAINNYLYNGGMDVKYGINESFTMDMTLIPDFGQVQSDNVILNLSPFEQRFSENRPFFTEGTELFNKAGIFYSRRVGSTPGGYYNALQLADDSGYNIIKNPARTQLYNATKISGRTKNNLGIGVFNAVTAPMYANLETNDGKTILLQTEPLANYNIVVFDQALKNRSYVNFTNTNVVRSGSARDANVSALSMSLFDPNNIYNLEVRGAYSVITGEDPHEGFSTNVEFGKVSGNWQWEVENSIFSEKFDPNDLGFLRVPNQMENQARLQYYQFQPGKVFNYRQYTLSVEQSNLFQPFKYQDFRFAGRFLHVFKNFWDVTARFDISPAWTNDYFELRTPGRVMKKTPYGFFALGGGTDSRKKLFVNYFLGFADLSPIKNDPFYLTEISLRYRFSPKFSIDISEERQDDKGNFGWVTFEENTGEPIIGLRRFLQLTSTMNAVYNFKARMSLNMRIRHYWSNVHYLSFYDVKEDGFYALREFREGYDRNFNLFNMDMFYSWDFRLGSRLLITWKNALGPDASIDGMMYNQYLNNFKQTFSIPHSNEVSVKFVYYIDYLDLKRKNRD